MVDEPDRIDEALTGALRVGLTVAGQVAERALRAREQAMREAQARSEQEARVLQARLDSERVGRAGGARSRRPRRVVAARQRRRHLTRVGDRADVAGARP